MPFKRKPLSEPLWMQFTEASISCGYFQMHFFKRQIYPHPMTNYCHAEFSLWNMMHHFPICHDIHTKFTIWLHQIIYNLAHFVFFKIAFEHMTHKLLLLLSLSKLWDHSVIILPVYFVFTKCLALYNICHWYFNCHFNCHCISSFLLQPQKD